MDGPPKRVDELEGRAAWKGGRFGVKSRAVTHVMVSSKRSSAVSNQSRSDGLTARSHRRRSGGTDGAVDDAELVRASSDTIARRRSEAAVDLGHSSPSDARP
jgi:hypothetical protein